MRKRESYGGRKTIVWERTIYIGIGGHEKKIILVRGWIKGTGGNRKKERRNKL